MRSTCGPAPLEDHAGRLLDVERDVDAAGEVVAGAQRQQAEHGVLEVVAAVQRRDHRVQAAVAAGHHDPAAAGAVQHAVELAGVGGGGHLDGGRSPRSTPSACSSVSSSAVPASLLVMTSSGSTGGH